MRHHKTVGVARLLFTYKSSHRKISACIVITPKNGVHAAFDGRTIFILLYMHMFGFEHTLILRSAITDREDLNEFPYHLKV